MLISYTFRGQEIDIDVTSKVEPYEWKIVGVSADVTAEEEEAIGAHIYSVLLDQAVNSCPED